MNARESILFRILQNFKVVLVCPTISIIRQIEMVFAFLALLPMTGMLFMIMDRAKRIAIMISVTAVMGIRKNLISMGVIAYPILTALRPR